MHVCPFILQQRYCPINPIATALNNFQTVYRQWNKQFPLRVHTFHFPQKEKKSNIKKEKSHKMVLPSIVSPEGMFSIKESSLFRLLSINGFSNASLLPHGFLYWLHVWQDETNLFQVAGDHDLKMDVWVRVNLFFTLSILKITGNITLSHFGKQK